MDSVVIVCSLGVLGLCLGSFAGAMVWRLRAGQLREDRAAGETFDKNEYMRLQKLLGRTGTDDRSVCLHCGHQLAWYDLLPLWSWASTKGTCRYCHAAIGRFEPLVEIFTAVLFICLYLFWPEPLDTFAALVPFVLWLMASVGLVILFFYDLRWMLLPDKVIIPVISIAAVIALLNLISAVEFEYAAVSLGGALLILSGIYFALWWISKGRWIGFGDVKLGIALALLLGDYQLAIIALFTANALGCIAVLIGMASKKMNRKNPIPFGPLLIVGTVIAQLAGSAILQWYLGLLT